jgi:hypothetical protein
MVGNNLFHKNNKAVNIWKFYRIIQINIKKIEKISNNGYLLYNKIEKWQWLLIKI